MQSAVFLLAGGVAGFGFGTNWKFQLESPKPTTNYTKLRADIEEILPKPGYDDGSLGPLFVRLAWHASGTYDKATNTGGSNGATMRFKPELKDGGNAGLDQA